MREKFKKVVSLILCLAMILSLLSISIPSATAVEGSKTEYVVKEDAYVRSSKGTTNFNFENIVKAHGDQYVGKGYTVINSKYYTEEIIGIMKFDLPTKEEIAEKQLDTFEFVFNIFKNANPTNGDQSYTFCYTTDNNWGEETITWNNKPASITRNSTNILFEFGISKGFEYETKDDATKRIQRDITETIEQLVEDGNTEVTIFVTAKNRADTSILIHSKETSPTNAAGKPARIIAYNSGINLDGLKDLVAACSTLEGDDYTTESFALFSAALSAANALIASPDPSVEAIKKAYRDLEGARNTLASNSDPNDSTNIAYKRPTRSNLSKANVYKVNDGDVNTSWTGEFYPSYVDIDLMDTYELEKVKVYLPTGKKCYYTLYGSNDGKNYDQLYQKRNLDPSTSDGDEITFDTLVSYRIIRVYLEYTQGEDKAYLSEVRAYGTKANTNTAELRSGTFEEILGIETYSETKYADPITEAEIEENIYGIIDRTIGFEYRDWFTFEIAPNSGDNNDYFELSDNSGRIHIKGNEGLSIATGLNYYYKNYLNVHISEQTMQVKMPDQLVPIGSAVRKETPYKIRYAFNYCTLSYTFAFFGEEDWQRENDWLALNGVNVVLDLAGQEATWIKFLMNFGYSFDDAKDWLTGPAYYAWQFMQNIETFGGPVPDGYVIDRVELARSSQRWKSSLGIQTILQGYAGMVPTNFNAYQPEVATINQGTWSNLSRPSMIATDSETYREYSELFYEAQEFVFGGNSHYYAVDPFHEGGKRPEGLSDETISEKVLDALLEYDADAVWVVQGWQSNPTNGLLKGMGDRREDHVLVIDLIKYPLLNWKKYDTLTYGSTKLDGIEFNGTSWAWGLLANFGGNPSMHGQLQVMVDDIISAQKKSQHMVGLGIISEAMYDNPIVYDLIFDLAWADDNFNLDQWMEGYIKRRYGGISENAKLAWKIMKDANYNHGVRYTNELFGTKYKAPQDFGTQNIPYGADKLETAFRLLIEDFDRFKDSECYRYDLTEIMRQLVSNYAVLTYNDVLNAQNARDTESFKENKQNFLKAFEVLNTVQATQKEQLAGEWIGKARDRAEEYDDFSEAAFEMNAKALITSWASRASMRNLKDYGWRNYEGMFNDIYTKVWTDYVNQVESNLEHGTPIQSIAKNDYFEMYWNWILSKQDYTRDAKNSPEEIQSVINLVLENCVLSSELDPNVGNLALKRTAIANTDDVSGKIRYITDGQTDTQFTARTGSAEKPEIIVDLIGEFEISKINVLLDYANGKYYNYKLYSSVDGTAWDLLAEKTDEEIQTETGDTFPVEEKTAKYIKIVTTDTPEITINEIRVYGSRVLPTLDQLGALILTVEKLDTSAGKPGEIPQFNTALNAAKAAVENSAAPDEVDSAYWTLYDATIALDISSIANVALGKPVTAMNDPSGYSLRAVDGDTSTNWNSGRLSPTGEDYQDEIVPGWLIVDLQGVYNVEEIKILFGNQSLWYQYEIYASLDVGPNPSNWLKLGGKATETSPNNKEDYYTFDGVKARYIKLVTTNIKLEAGGKRNSYAVAELMVLGTPAISVTGVELDKTDVALISNREGDKTTQLTATVLPVDADNKAVIWSSDTPTVATVNQNGLVTAVADGTATITVTTADGGYTDTCAVTVSTATEPGETYTVTVPYAENGSVTASPISAEEGNPVTLTIAPADGYELNTISVSKTGESGTSVALTGTGETRTFEMPGYNVTVTATFKKTVDQIKVEAAKATIEETTYTVPQVTANTKDAVKTWLEEKIATLDGMTGITVEVTVADEFTAAVAATGTEAAELGSDGSFTFAVLLTKGNSTTATGSVSGTIIRTPYTPPDQTVAPTFTSNIQTFATAEATTITFTLTAEAENITYMIYETAEGGTALSTVNASNTGTALTLTFTAQPAEETTYYISATEDGKTESSRTAITVKPYVAPESSEKQITDFTIDGVAGVIDQTNHTISITLPEGTDVTALTPTVTISEHATVNPSGAQNFTDAVIYTVTAEDGTTQGYIVTVTVEQPGGPIAVTGVTLDKSTYSLYHNGTPKTVQLIATVTPGDAANRGVTWNSSNTAVATVDQSGLVTGVADGTATVTVTTVDGGYTATCTVTVSTYVDETPTYTPPTTKTETRKNGDGSTTKIVTNLKTGTVTETTTWPDGTKIVTTTGKDGTGTSEVTVPKDKDSVTVTIPTAQQPGPGQVAVIVKPDGTREIVKTSVATEDGMRVTLTEGAKLEIIDNSKRFIDVETKDWFDASVQFVASRELFTGTSANTFSPDAPTSRAMLMTVLARLDGQDTAVGETWDSVGMAWARENGISDGTNGESGITREQLALMLYRYAKAEKPTGGLDTYSDASQVSAWAAEAMAWAVEQGIIQGAAGKLNPTDIATRAEVAAMLERFVKR